MNGNIENKSRTRRSKMKKITEGFMLGAATAAHQVEGNNIYNDYWAQ